MSTNIKKYIFITDGYRGGANTFMNDHMDYLIKKKQKVILIDKEPKKTFDKLNSKIKSFQIDPKQNRQTVINCLENIIKLNENKKIYLMITNFAFLIKFYFFLKRFKSKNNKIILTIHSGIFNMTIKSYIIGLIFSIIYKEVDYLFFGSFSSKSWWKKVYMWMKIDKCIVHYNGIKLIKKKSLKKIGKNIQISFAGRLERENNPEFFLNIAEKYIENNKHVIFNIFGDGPLLKELRKKYSSRNIIFHGWVTKQYIYKITNIIMITSPLNNFPYVAMEAKSYGIPVISCSKGDIKKIIKNNVDGFLKYTNSIQDMIVLIKKVKKDYKKFSRNSLIRSRKYEINNSCKKFWNSIDV